MNLIIVIDVLCACEVEERRVDGKVPFLLLSLFSGFALCMEVVTLLVFLVSYPLFHDPVQSPFFLLLYIHCTLANLGVSSIVFKLEFTCILSNC